MALNDSAVLTAAVGYVYTGAVGAAAPTPAALKTIDLLTPGGWTATGWTSIGHTSRNDMPEFGFDGGDTEVRGSWQNANLKEVTTDQPADYLTLHLNQFDESALDLYFGPNSVATEGLFSISGDPVTSNEKALLIVIEDGDFRLGFHASKANIRRDDAISLPIDDFASLPIRATFLKYSSDPLFTWINEDLFNPA